MRKVFVTLFLALALAVGLAANVVLAQNQTGTTTTTSSGNQTVTASLSSMIGAAMSNPQTAVVMLIEFALGFGLGYTAIKALKYILAFIGILLLGSALSVWSVGNSAEDIAKELGGEVKQFIPMIKNLIATFSLIVVGPASVGFILGIIVGIMRK